MVATSHPAATLAAIDVLREGGNAVDAAVCAAAVQAVVEPTQTGIGGDCFAMLMRPGDRKPIAINGSGWSPKAISLDFFANSGAHEIPIESPHSVTIPGAVSAWEILIQKHGRLPWARVLAPAIELAENGSCIPERLSRDWNKQESKLKRTEAAASLFLFEGKPPTAGTLHKQPALARTLRTISAGGAAEFYRGGVGADLVATLQEHGGLHTIDDFTEFAAEYVQPIFVDYRGYRLWECPPNGQGIVAMLMARGMEQFNLSAWPSISSERFHLQAEFSRLAYATRDAFVADPRTGKIPVDWLLSDAHVHQMRQKVSLTTRIGSLKTSDERPHSDTVFICVVDRDRNAVALINSIFEDFGSGIVCARTGIVLHNRGSSFSLKPGHPNALAGRKRPMHTIIPAILARGDRPVMTFGVTGAHFQPIGQMQILANTVDYGMSIQRAIDHPRMFARDEMFEVERTVPESVAQALRELGHNVTRPENPLGTAQAIWIDYERGILRGGADGRRDGIALGY